MWDTTAAATDLTSTVAFGLKSLVSGFSEFRYDHDEDDNGLLPGQITGGTVDGSATANNGIADAAENGTTDVYPGDIADPATAATTTSHPATGAIDVRVDDLSITEVMWALNDAVIGQDTADDRQWIEIHNRNTKAAVPLDGLVLTIQSGHPPTSLDDTAVVDTGNVSARIAVDSY